MRYLILLLILFFVSCKPEPPEPPPQPETYTVKYEVAGDAKLVRIFYTDGDCGFKSIVTPLPRTIDFEQQGVFRFRLNVQKTGFGKGSTTAAIIAKVFRNDEVISSGEDDSEVNLEGVIEK